MATCFLDALPTDIERELYDKLAPVLERSNTILESMRSYAGCNAAIAKAISKPSRESDEEVWTVLIPAVAVLKDFYLFSQEISALAGRGE